MALLQPGQYRDRTSVGLRTRGRNLARSIERVLSGDGARLPGRVREVLLTVFLIPTRKTATGARRALAVHAVRLFHALPPAERRAVVEFLDIRSTAAPLAPRGAAA